MLTLGHIVAALADYKIAGDEAAISAVVVDSREARPQSLFVAFAGEQVDGHDYVADAFSRGAIMALVERPIAGQTVLAAAAPLPTPLPIPFCLQVPNTEAALQQIARYWRGQFDVHVIGITGSVGKTSTKELTHAVLSQRFHTLKSAGNRNNELGLPLTLLELQPHHTHAVLEMGMYALGEIALLADIARPHVGVVTNIGPVHMERLGSMEAITTAKRELIEALPSGGTAILNRDDPLVMSMAAHVPAGVKTFTYGLTDAADLWADNIASMGLEGIRFTLHYAGEAWHLQVPLLGRHSVHTALRATAVGLVEGMTLGDITRGLQGMQSQLRLVTARGPHGSLILDDTYNASPDSVIAALNLLADLDGRKVAVLGDMLELGAAEEEGHRMVGRRAKAVADVLVVVGPRGRIIGEEALAVGMDPKQVHFAPTTAAAVTFLQDNLHGDDTILIKGSLGMRMDAIVSAISERVENKSD